MYHCHFALFLLLHGPAEARLPQALVSEKKCPIYLNILRYIGGKKILRQVPVPSPGEGFSH